MEEISILVGGKAGDGIRQAGQTVARLLNRQGYRIFFYDDYPSLIRGGHNFSIVRAAEKKIMAHKDKVDLVVALNQETVEKHQERLPAGGLVLYDSDTVAAEGVGLPLTSIVKQLKGSPIMKNTAAVGALARILGFDWQLAEKVLSSTVEKDLGINLEIARQAFEKAGQPRSPLKRLNQQVLPLVSGNEAVALGAVQAGLDLYIAYPMTPASGILHYLAAHEEELGLVTIHPESEIAVALMALGAAYAGARAMVGTSGGGFALMTEALSLAGQGEFPLVVVECQRAGPSTGVPTYTMQGDLFFVLHAGHGEFVRTVLAPADAEDAFYLSALALKLAWQFQIPTFVLSDKHLSESIFSFAGEPERIEPAEPLLWNQQGEYKRYLDTESGVSPLAYPGTAAAVVKATSYEHDEYGLTTEEPSAVARMQDKRLRKRQALLKELGRYEQVRTFGDPEAGTALLCWGSSKGACMEVAEELGLRVVQPLLLEPFPRQPLKTALAGAERVIAVETNATGQLATLVSSYGLAVDHRILRFDGRPFTVDGLLKEVKEVTQ